MEALGGVHRPSHEEAQSGHAESDEQKRSGEGGKVSGREGKAGKRGERTENEGLAGGKSCPTEKFPEDDGGGTNRRDEYALQETFPTVFDD